MKQSKIALVVGSVALIITLFSLISSPSFVQSAKMQIASVRGSLLGLPKSVLSTCTIDSFTTQLPQAYAYYSNFHDLFWTTTGCTGVSINDVRNHNSVDQW